MKPTTLILAFLLFSVRITAQLYTQYSYPGTVSNLVLSNFSGSGVQISNVQYTGFSLSPTSPIKDLGFFNAENTNLGIDSGIILTSGFLDPPYGLGQPATTWANYIKYSPGDSLLDSIISPYITWNAVVLEFDFVPNGDSIKFNYVFASDEYNHDVCNTNNDVFAFHISGPGIIGNQNIAVVPGTTIPVSINSINNGSPGPAWSSSTCISLSYSQYFADHNADTDFIFNGATTVMTATAPTIPCQTYHLRFAIADGEDSYENSAVFLQANSFNSDPIGITPSVSYGGPDTLLYEGCGFATLVIRRTYNLQQAKTYTINYSGTSTYNLDYSSAPMQITMQPGQMYDTILIFPLADGLPDNSETLLISIGDTLCNGDYYVSQIEMLINEKQGLVASILPGSGNFCDTVTFISLVDGAVEPYTLSWDNGVSSDSTYDYFSLGSHIITLDVNDACGQTVQAIVSAQFGNYPVADFTYSPPYIDILTPLVSFYDLSSSNVTAWSWSFDEGLNISTLQNPTFYYSTPDTYSVKLIVFTDIGCSDTTNKTIIVHDIPTLYLPNAFTPNNDLTNDLFNAYGNEIAYFRMTIFDRWGNEVYSTDSISGGWDGTLHGAICPIGIYTVQISFSFNQNPNEIYIKRERLSLIR